MKDVISQIHEWIKLVSQVGLGLIALGVIAEIVFGKGAIFGASVIGNLQQIVTDWWREWLHRIGSNPNHFCDPAAEPLIANDFFQFLRTTETNNKRRE